MKKVFISYSHADREFAQKLAYDLLDFGIDVWIDLREIKHDDSIFQKINEGLELRDLLVIIMSPDSVDSYWVHKELDAAFSKKTLIIPVLIKTCLIPPLLLAIEYVDFQQSYYEGFYKLMKRILAAVSTSLGGIGVSRKQYIGLQEEPRAIPCSYCDGTGFDEDLEGHGIECKYCGGKGRIEEPED